MITLHFLPRATNFVLSGNDPNRTTEEEKLVEFSMCPDIIFIYISMLITESYCTHDSESYEDDHTRSAALAKSVKTIRAASRETAPLER